MTIRLLTGLHIGGNNDSMKIGGIDSEVIKREIFIYEDGEICYIPEFDDNGDLKNGVKKVIEPYIPGSSIKGKVRSLLEYSFGLINEQKKLFESEKQQGQVISSKFIKETDDEELKKLAKLIVELFGESAGNGGEHITRVIFRDCFLTKEIRKTAFIKERLSLSEEKAENTINRISSMANPRFIERVPAGVEFEFDYVIRDYLDDKEKIELFKDTILFGLLLLEDDSLGGGGSRGNGRIEFSGIEKKDKKELFESIKDRVNSLYE
jgi:CRISPR-associated protein Csm3